MEGLVKLSFYCFTAASIALAGATVCYLVYAIGRIEPMALTSELSIRYLRPAQGRVLWARATLDSVGRRNVVGTVHVWTDENEHRPSSVAQGTYVLPATPTEYPGSG